MRMRRDNTGRFIPTRVGQTPNRLRGHGRGLRFIPTRVGQTSAPYPLPVVLNGSSPRVWGRHIVNTGVLSPMSRRSLNRLSQPCQHLPDCMASQALRA